VLLVAVSLCVMIIMMLLIPVAMYVYPVLAVSDICADCCSKMFTSVSVDQLNVFVFLCVCATVSPSMSLVWIVIRVNAPTAPANAGVSHGVSLFSCH